MADRSSLLYESRMRRNCLGELLDGQLPPMASGSPGPEEPRVGSLFSVGGVFPGECSHAGKMLLGGYGCAEGVLLGECGCAGVLPDEHGPVVATRELIRTNF